MSTQQVCPHRCIAEVTAACYDSPPFRNQICTNLRNHQLYRHLLRRGLAMSIMGEDVGQSPDGPRLWHPAFRPDSDRSVASDSEPPSQPAKVPPEEQRSLPDDIAEKTVSNGGALHGGHVPLDTIAPSEVTTGDQFLDKHGMSLDLGNTKDQSRETQILPPTPPEPSEYPAPEQEDPPEQTSSDVLKDAIVPDDRDAPSQEQPPSDAFEFETETTALDQAVQEDATMPLAADASSTIDWGDTGESFDIVGDTPQSGAAVLSGTLAAFDGAQDGVEPPVQSQGPRNSGEEIDWGASDSDAFNFDVGVTEQLQATGGEARTGTDGKEKDLDAMWQAALGEDDLLDSSTSVDPGAFFVDDGEGFLDEGQIADRSTAQQAVSQISNNVSKNRYAPPTQSSPAAPHNQYAPSNPQFTNLSQPPNGTSSSGFPQPHGPPTSFPQPYQQTSRPLALSASKSFADKSRGGYSSPYDLPDDISVRKRPSKAAFQRPSPPQPTPPPMQQNHTSPAVPQIPSGTSTSKSNAPLSTPPTDFFAELPSANRSRQTPPPSRYAPTPASQPPVSPQVPSLPSTQQDHRHPLATELRPPERLPMFPDVSSDAPSLTSETTAPTQSRYSPLVAPQAPSSGKYSPIPSSGPPSQQRYSSNHATYPPANQPASAGDRDVASYAQPQNIETSAPARPPSQTYAPRTSSPLAQHNNVQSYSHTPEAQDSVPGLAGMPPQDARSLSPPETLRKMPPLTVGTPPPPRSGPPSLTSSPRKSSQSNYVPQNAHISSEPQSYATQNTLSPTSIPRAQVPLGQESSFPPPSAGPQTKADRTRPAIPHRRMFSRDFDFVKPTDEQSQDPLERWRGYPIFKWGLGGTVLTSFPKLTPRYGVGQSIPMLKCGPGELKVHNLRELYPLPESVAKFPGPLRSKGKKKEVITWLKTQIDVSDRNFQIATSNHSLPADDQKRAEERLLLLKMLQLFIEHDGTLEGSPTVEEAARALLAPSSDGFVDPAAAMQSESPSASLDLSSSLRSEPADGTALESIRGFLEKGEREKATWFAADHRLWAHAMLISSTLNKEIWKQVVQEFVRREVKGVGGPNEPMAALYAVFAGSWEESIDELVPVSARAGFQMVSKSGASGTVNNALAGLEKWRSTLLLILSNRSDGDAQAISSLGKLLAGYGRAEAAHVCYLFARSMTYFAGADDPASNVVLIGADHVRNPQEVGQDMDSILLTEIYEFGLSLSGTAATSVIPHLQPYKLIHAHALAEYGNRSEAQLYCDAIANCMKSSTRSSPYYHAQFVTQLDDLSKRLSQSPKDSSASWISKPSMDKVSSNMWTKFSNFVAGDESDNASNASGVTAGEMGPFGRVPGDSPDLSRSASVADLYGPYSGAPAAPNPASGANSNSRYAPGASTANRSSFDSPNVSRYERSSPNVGRPSMESGDSMSRQSFEQPGAASHSPMAFPGTANLSSQQDSHAQFQRGRQPLSAFAGAVAPERSQSHQPQGARSYAPIPQSAPQDLSSTYNSPSYAPEYPSGDAGSSGRGPSIELSSPTATSGPPVNSYDPSRQGTYEAPSYQPYMPDADAGNEANDATDSQAPKRSFMDDDDDEELVKRAAQLKKQQAAEADRKADEAFRKAAEADSAKDAPGKKGWFGGWFKKDPNQAPGPIKAKLGEESSFVFDPALGKWVNKKGGDSGAGPSAPTPPPPRAGPPGRTMTPPQGPGLTAPPPAARPPMGGASNTRSSSMPPPSMSTVGGAGAKASTPPGPDSSATDRPPHPLHAFSLPGSGANAPPSRPNTAVSNASSIDDLLGAPAARKGGTVKKNKKARGYVNVLE